MESSARQLNNNNSNGGADAAGCAPLVSSLTKAGHGRCAKIDEEARASPPPPTLLFVFFLLFLRLPARRHGPVVCTVYILQLLTKPRVCLYTSLHACTMQSPIRDSSSSPTTPRRSGSGE